MFTTFHENPIFHFTGCKVTSGEHKNKPCVFPFIYVKVPYNKCTTIHNDGKPWCSTKTDENDNHIKSHWGNCSEKCSSRSNLGSSQFLEAHHRSWEWLYGNFYYHHII